MLFKLELDPSLPEALAALPLPPSPTTTVYEYPGVTENEELYKTPPAPPPPPEPPPPPPTMRYCNEETFAGTVHVRLPTDEKVTTVSAPTTVDTGGADKLIDIVAMVWSQ